MLREGAPVTERLLRSLRGTASCVGDGVALRPYTVPASLALVPSALPRLSIRPSAEARGPVYLSSRPASPSSALEHAHAGSVYKSLSFRQMWQSNGQAGQAGSEFNEMVRQWGQTCSPSMPFAAPFSMYASGSRKRSAGGVVRIGLRTGHHSAAGRRRSCSPPLLQPLHPEARGLAHCRLRPCWRRPHAWGAERLLSGRSQPGRLLRLVGLCHIRCLIGAAYAPASPVTTASLQCAMSAPYRLLSGWT